MHATREGFVVRVLRAGSAVPAGVGFVVGNRHVLTCAHVVNTALGRASREQQAPGAQLRVWVDFPLLGYPEEALLRNCRVQMWEPPPVAGVTGGDVAGLVLVGEDLPAGASPARLAEAVDVREAKVDLFGYPGEPPRPDGAWAHCALSGAVGRGMIQLEANSEAAFRAQPGYSGSPAVVADGVGDAVVGMLAVASRDDEGRDAYAIPMARLVDAWPEVLGGVPACPYRGLLPFRAEDAQAGLFVGREEEVARLRRMVQQCALVVVVGPSGVGKSSLVNAGLLPALLGTGQWAAATFRPGGTPFFALAKALYELEGSDHGLEDVDRRAEQIRREGLAGLAGRLSVLIGKRVLLHADQFEEMLTTCPEGERAEFLDRVLPAVDVDDTPYRLVCTLRADFLHPLLEHPGVGPRLQDRLLPLSPMDVAALECAVSEPARVRGVTYEDGLARQIATDAAGGGGGLPLMEFALTELWAHQHQRRLTFADYHALGGVAGALNRYAEGVFAELAERGLGNRVRRVMLALIRSREGAAQANRRIVGRDRLAHDWDVVEELARRYLLIIDDWAELAHEALIRSWSRLAAWVDSDASFQRWLVTMEDRVAEDELLPEARISEADRWLAERPDDIPAEVRELVEGSRTLRLTLLTDELEPDQDTVTRAFAMAGYDLEPSDSPGVLVSDDGLVVTTGAVDTLGVVGTHLRSGSIAYVVHAGRLPESAEQQLDRLRVDGKLIVPLSFRALDAALSDGDVGSLLADLRNYATRDNLFDMKNALVDNRHFFGRDAVLTRMGSLTRRDEHILLTGLRKVGKTSLLNIFRQHLLRYPVCKIDLQLYDRNVEDWHLAIFAQALRAFDAWARKKRSSWTLEQDPPATATAFRDALDMRLDKLGPDGRNLRLALLLDEVERVFPVQGEDEATRRWLLAAQSLRALAQASQRRLVIVAADLRPIANRVNLMSRGETNPFFQLFHEMVIPLFDLDATREMLTAIGMAMNIQVDEDFVRSLHRLTGGHPSFARSFAAEASRRRSSRRFLTPRDLDLAVQAMLENGEIDAFLQNNIWDPMTIIEKQVVTAFVHGEGGLESTGTGSGLSFEWRQAVVNLRQQGLLDRDLVTIGILAQWIRERKAGALL